MDTRFYLVSAVEDKHRGGSSFCFRSAPYPGKGRKMKKLNDFEYDLWTTEDGKRMVRVRLTKEECQVDRETFRLLRAEEKRLRRERTPEKREGVAEETVKRPLSLDILDPDAEGAFWHTDPRDLIEESILGQMLAQFRLQLTTRQLDVFEKCLLGGMNLSEYARRERLNYCTVWEVREAIRKKFSRF